MKHKKLSPEKVECRNRECCKVFVRTSRGRMFCSNKCARHGSHSHNREELMAHKKETYNMQRVWIHLRDIDMSVTPEEKELKIKSELKLEVIEAKRGAENGVLSMEDYEEEIRQLSVKHSYGLNELEDYAKHLKLEPVSFEYNRTANGEVAVYDI